MSYVTYGTGALNLLHFPIPTKVSPASTLGNDAQVASTQPAIVPVTSAAAVDNPANLPTSSSSPATAVNGNGAPVAQTSAGFSLAGYFASVLANPGQHIVGVIIIAIALWWLYKHVLKKI